MTDRFYNDTDHRQHPEVDADDDGEARYEQQARDDSPPEPCPDCECCDKAWCWAELCAAGTCPCTEAP